LIADSLPSIATRAPRSLSKPLFILLLTLAGFAVMGYHPGLEDDAVYLSAVKARLNPTLYPHDGDFVLMQVQATVFDEFVAGFVYVTHIPVPWAELLLQLLSLYTILWAAHGIAQMLFGEERAARAGTALLSAMLTLPVAGTALNIADQHLHPRNMATALILIGVERMLGGKRWQAVGVLGLALVMHPIMAALGISLCFFLALAQVGPENGWRWAWNEKVAVAALPLAWVFEPATTEWRRALETRKYYFLFQWTWYEWLGAIGPLVLFTALLRWQAKAATANTRDPMARFALGVLLYSAFHQALAMGVLATPALVRGTPLQPMRYLHLVYVFMVLIAGGLAGRHVLDLKLWRWALFLVAANGGMFAAQRALLPDSEHLELPGRAPHNEWLQAFAWIRENTPVDAYFALDPNYLAASGEDYHGFRAVAERSQLADAIKDAAVATQVPELAPRWAKEVDAQAGWSGFQWQDFERLNSQFGVDWVLLSYPPPHVLSCRWHNRRVTVCRIGDRVAVRVP
jgi:hypothetical protein